MLWLRILSAVTQSVQQKVISGVCMKTCEDLRQLGFFLPMLRRQRSGRESGPVLPTKLRVRS